MPKSNQLSPRVELEMAIRGYQRICTLQSAATPARCREACPSSQCVARRARTIRPTWGNTRTHVSDDITRPSPRRRRGLWCSRKVVVFFWKRLEGESPTSEHQERISRQIPFSPKKWRMQNLLQRLETRPNDPLYFRQSSRLSSRYTGSRPPRVSFVLFPSSCRSLHF